MKIIKTSYSYQEYIAENKAKNNSIGFVPTMGALHDGHLELVKKCRRENDICVVSIFVNPTQFNDKSDLEKYPRTPDKDISQLKAQNVDILFMPEINEMYPDDSMNSFDLGGIDEILEGKFRPGHFEGVADVVFRLFTIVSPNKAYFGEKDYQQLKIIERMVSTKSLSIDIVGIPTVREKNGLAKSSRNQRLSENAKEKAALIFNSLQTLAKEVPAIKPIEYKEKFKKIIDSSKLLETEYVEILEENGFKPINDWSKNNPYRVCVAVWCENVRLIDNIQIVIK